MQGDKQSPTSAPPEANWHYSSDPAKQSSTSQPVQSNDDNMAPLPQEESVTWTASEFVDHHKGIGWYLLLAIAAAAIIALVYFLTTDLVSVIVIGLLVLLLAFTAGRKPRTLTYSLNNAGFSIGSKKFYFSEFKSFSLVEEGMVPGIMFLPLKRFMPTLTIYYDPADEAQIAAILSQSLPMEEHEPDFMDWVTTRIRF